MKSSKAKESKRKNKILEYHPFGIFPKQPFEEGAPANLFSAMLISLLHYTVHKTKKKIHTFSKTVMNESLRL